MSSSALRVVGRYQVGPSIGSGGMATVHLGRLFAPAGFSRTVAIKQLRAMHSADADLSAMLLQEAKLAARIRHPNVVAPLDVVVLGDETFIVMEYVHGESLAGVMRLLAGTPVPMEIATAIMGQVLLGLHAAHRATSEDGQPLGLVHRDVSPQNIMLASDGTARLVDFGVAKAESRAVSTQRGLLKGKLGYVAPEQVAMETVDHRTDLFAAGVVLWEMLTGQHLFASETPNSAIEKLSKLEVPPPSQMVPGLPVALDRIIVKALARDPADRFPDAHAMAVELEAAAPSASPIELAGWLHQVAGDLLDKRAKQLAELESVELGDVTIDLPLPVPAASAPVPAAPTMPRPKPITESRSPSSSRSSVVPSRGFGRARRDRAVLGVAMGLALAALGVASFGILRQRENAETRLSVQPLTPLPERTAEPLSNPQSKVPTSIPHVTSVSSAAPEAISLEAPTAGEHRATAKAKPLPPRSPSARSEKPSGTCAIPYPIDANGVKRFNPECF
jgi:serine/threonine-protein kinase